MFATPNFFEVIIETYLFFKHKHFSVMTLRKYSKGAFFF